MSKRKCVVCGDTYVDPNACCDESDYYDER